MESLTTSFVMLQGFPFIKGKGYNNVVDNVPSYK